MNKTVTEEITPEGIIKAKLKVDVEEAVMNELTTKTEVLGALTKWFKKHPEGCGWGMGAEETAQFIIDKYLPLVNQEADDD